jgi:spore germination protein YaaH
MTHAFSTGRFLAGFFVVALAMTGCGGSPSPSTPSSTENQTSEGANSASAGANAAAAPHSQHHRCGWLGADTFDAGKASFLANPDYFDAIHPTWVDVHADGSLTTNHYADDQQIMQTAQAHGVKVIPLAFIQNVEDLRAILSSTANISAHAQAVLNLVIQHGYDGIELDYEHLWSNRDRAPEPRA